MIKLNGKLVNKLVTVYSTTLSEEYISGFIIQYDVNEMILACIDIYGNNNGYILLRLDDIYRLDYDSEYEIKLLNLYRLNKQKHDKIVFNTVDIAYMDDLLLWAYEKRKLVTVKFENNESEMCGYIEDINYNKMQLIDINECKGIKGVSFVDFQSTDWIWVDEKKSRDAEMIMKYKGDSCIV